MITTLIVEDELLARAGLHTLLDWEALGFTLLEDAKDGKEALERIRSERPELVLLDINIPIFSGLEVLQQLKDEGILVKVIIISCYDDFDTVKTAMQLGAVDYIRKFGITKEQLSNVLAAASQRPLLQPVLNPMKLMAQTMRDIKERVRSVPQGYENGCCLCFYIIWRNTDERSDLKIVETLSMQSFHNLDQEIEARTFEGKLLVFTHMDRIERRQIEVLLSQMEHFLLSKCYVSITYYQKDKMPDDFFAYVGNAIETVGFYGESDYIIEMQEPVPIRIDYPFDINVYYDMLDAALDKMSHENLAAITDRLFAEIEQVRYLSVHSCKKLMIEILGRFSAKANKLSGTIEEVVVLDSNKHYQKVVNMTSYSHIKEWFYIFIKNFTELFFTRQKCSDSDIVQNTVEYIDAHIFSSIQLSEVARSVGVSEPYLSTFFKKSMGENFIPYVNRKKVELAKDLLREGKLVYQVSELLGFENNTYFSKVFKRVEGITPEQYRKNQE